MCHQQEADQFVLFAPLSPSPSPFHSALVRSRLSAASGAPHQVRRFAKAAGLKAPVLKCAQLYMPPKWGWASFRLLNAPRLKWATGEREPLDPRRRALHLSPCWRCCYCRGDFGPCCHVINLLQILFSNTCMSFICARAKIAVWTSKSIFRQ